MKHTDFNIGSEFSCGENRWRCTDVGSRVITAIRLTGNTVTRVVNSKEISESLPFEKADADGWFNGPPYAVSESVFDEDDFEGCEPVAAGTAS